MVFLDIFSNKPAKEQPQAQIIIDTREKQSLVASYLAEKKANIKWESLEIADYIINNIAIERKTYSDFISSMINKRLFSQLENLKKYPEHFIIIEGNDNWKRINAERTADYLKGKSHPTKPLGVVDKAAKGMIISIITKYKIPIIFTENEQDTAETLIQISKQQEKNEKPQSLRFTPTLLTKDEQKQFILEGFPNIGPTTAKKLLEKYKTLNNIFNASEKELEELIGKKASTFNLLRD